MILDRAAEAGVRWISSAAEMGNEDAIDWLTNLSMRRANAARRAAAARARAEAEEKVRQAGAVATAADDPEDERTVIISDRGLI